MLRSVRTSLCTCALFVAAACAPAHAQDATGDWHGVLRTPTGDLTVILTVETSDDGSLGASLESPDQAPGRKIPISSISVSDGQLQFAIQAIGARYAGTWSRTDDRWSGTWTQGGEIPLDLERGLPPKREVVEGLDGRWEGTVTRNGVDLRLILDVNTGDLGTVVTLDSPDLAAMNIPVTEFTRTSNRVTLTVPATGVTFEGTLSEEGDELTGPWRMPGRPDATVTFVRTPGGQLPRRERPQTPGKSVPYDVENVRFENARAAGVTLAGTLTLPRGAGPFPAAVLISGSGPQDRDQTVWGHKTFAVLADHLTREGVAVLRYDDRGFGESTGDFGTATSADFATDANAAISYLTTRPELDRDALGLIGHSEGGVIGPIATASNDEIDFLVLLAAPGTSTLELILSQRRLLGLSQGVSEERLARGEVVFERIVRAVAGSRDRDDARRRVLDALEPGDLEALGVPENRRDILVQQFTTDWYRYFASYDPGDYLARVRVPVLALNGSLDVQVPAPRNLAGIAEALKHNPDVTTHELEGLNHLFQTARTGALGEYADISETFAPSAMEIIARWIAERFGTSYRPQRGA